jgi:periplasmic divalent cation tolerance protein
VIKTRAERWEDFEALLRALHPYTVPEILGVVTTAGYRPYLDWVGESVAAKGGE